MGGIAFALFYSGLAIPIAWLADRKSRVNIIAVSVALWSAFTAACGLAQNFWQLFLARMGVGIGEAGGVAPSYALISDFYPEGAAGPGARLVLARDPDRLGARGLLRRLDRQPSRLALGLPHRRPRRPARRPCWSGSACPSRCAAASTPPTAGRASRRRPSSQVVATLAAQAELLAALVRRRLGLDPRLRPDLLAAELLQPKLRARARPRSAGSTARSCWSAESPAPGSAAGSATGSAPANPGAYALVPAICFLIAAPVFAFGLFAPSLTIGWILFAIGQMLALAWLGPVIAAVQHIVPPNMRATASASFLFINNLIGIGFGIFFLGFMSDRMTAAHGEDALQYSILYGLGFYVLSALIYLAASTRLKRDWHRG